ncbi:uncharacterized protein ACO6RY_16060 [Pungitius sinensis]
MAPLQPEDSHDLCPFCLGLKHLREGLSEAACMDCGIMSRAVRAASLAEVERLGGDDTPYRGIWSQLNLPVQNTGSQRPQGLHQKDQQAIL